MNFQNRNSDIDECYWQLVSHAGQNSVIRSIWTLDSVHHNVHSTSWNGSHRVVYNDIVAKHFWVVVSHGVVVSWKTITTVGWHYQRWSFSTWHDLREIMFVLRRASRRQDNLFRSTIGDQKHDHQVDSENTKGSRRKCSNFPFVSHEQCSGDKLAKGGK